MIEVFNQNGIHAFFLNAEESENFENPMLLTQIHSPDVVTVTSEKTPILPEADAWVTAEKGKNLTIKTADCAPVLFVDEVNRIIGASHAGWKGAFQGVLERTLLTMLQNGAEIKNIKAFIGPCLQKQSFEISDEMKKLFSKNCHNFFTPKGDKWLFDFENYVEFRLKSSGVQSVFKSGIDTFTSPEYNSFRRNPDNPARQFSVIRKD